MMARSETQEERADVLTVDQAADYLQVSKVTIWRWLSTGKLPGAKIGGRWRILRREIDGLLEGEPDMAAASEAAFAEVWDNDEDAIYDNWRELYGVSEG